MRLALPLLAATIAAAPLALHAQSAANPSSDSTAAPSTGASASPVVTYGATAGALGLSDGRTQSGVTAVIRWHPLAGFALGATPAFAQASYPASLGGGSASGLTDLPVEASYDHTFAGVLPTTLGAAFGVSLPVGDTATGFGSGSLGYTINGGVNVQATDKLSVYAGAGRPLSDFASAGALGGSNSTWGDIEGSYQLTDRVTGTLGFDGDFASSDTLGAARTLVTGVAIGIDGPLTLTANAAKGISGPAANWQFSVGLGTDFAGLQNLGSSSPVQRVVRALGGRSHSGSITHGQSGLHGRP